MLLAIRLRDAMNAHDLEAFLDCFHEDYRSEQPAHPGRGFAGREQVRANWSAVFAGVPDFSATLLGHCQDGDREWSEWRWTGTRAGAGDLDVAGVVVLGVRDGRVAWGRLYMEPVSGEEEGIDAAVRTMTGEGPGDG
ncbi:hypothetical protein GCM10027261_09160 [Geodermatophilus arenarius]|uniref:Nuclear transport factor 2 family protein n=1 Tax=Geodermatophilus arenarius TaxID=1137990 RepID=A0ABV9LQ88_9ACTN